MRVEGKTTLEAPREVAWRVVSDTARVARLLPGISDVRQTNDRQWRARLRLPFSPLTVGITLEQTVEDAPEHAAMRAHGKTFGGGVELVTGFTLADEGATTGLDYYAETQLSGPFSRIGSVGLRPVVETQIRHLLDALRAEVAHEQGADDGREVGA